MTKRGVINIRTDRLDSGGTCTWFRVEESFGDLDPGSSIKLTCKSTDEEFIAMRRQPSPLAVVKAGRKLFEALNTSQGVQLLFAQMATGDSSGTAKQAPVYPLFLKIEDPAGPEELPWEVLWNETRSFFVLDKAGRWPVARLVPSTARPLRIVKTIGPKLRITLVLAAADVRDGNMKEWESFKKALNQLNVPVYVLVLVSEAAVLEQVKKDIAAWDESKVSGAAEYVGEQKSLLSRIVRSAPNVLHFFCHGKIDVFAQLQIETRVGRIKDPERKSDNPEQKPNDSQPEQGGDTKAEIVLVADNFTPVVALQSLWLIVLNCCSGAQPAQLLNSLAKALVQKGVPAVVAMREPVEVADANFFTEHFYLSLLNELEKGIATIAAKTGPTESVELEELLWMRPTDNARQKLSEAFDRIPNDNSQWSQPVLYVYRGEVFVEKREPSTRAISKEEKAEVAAQLRTLRVFYDGMRPGVDAEMDEKRQALSDSIQQLEDLLAG